MNCAEISQLLDAYADGELDVAHSLAIEEHLAGCEKCAEQLRVLRALRDAITPARFSAPDDLRASVLANLPTTFPRVATSHRWLTNGLALAAALALGFLVAQFFQHTDSEKTLLAVITDNHIRALAGTHLVDVPSSDQHTVRPWFEGKIDFAPPVEDLSGAGFPLVGGRLEFIDSRAVAALVYERRKHFINLFVWPATKAEPITPAKAQRGYNILHWANGEMNFWAVSEINEEDLRKFAAAFNATR